jgi:hypothetical protein
MIEADPKNFGEALTKGRNVTLVPACLSLTTKAKLTKFTFGVGAISKIDQGFSSKSINVQCLPLYSILLALNQTTVDLFSLDIEGNELDVLRTIPFDKVNIKVHADTTPVVSVLEVVCFLYEPFFLKQQTCSQ